jgi:hypothetical protein
MAYPRGLPRRYRHHWSKPWGLRARKSRGFHLWCWRRGYVSPNFTKAEWRCKDGTNVPDSLRKNAQRHAFNLERLRKRLNGARLPIMSGYRHPAYNRRIGGASQSRHMQADATDFSTQTVNRIGRNRFFAQANIVFRNGGVGNYPSGSAHCDSRGYRARWRSF